MFLDLPPICQVLSKSIQFPIITTMVHRTTDFLLTISYVSVTLSKAAQDVTTMTTVNRK